MKPKWQAAALALFLALLAVGLGMWVAHARGTAAPAGEEEEHEEAAKVTAPVAVIGRGRLDSQVEVTGTLRLLPSGRARLAPQVAGRLVTLSVRPGDRVRAGQVLAVVEHRDLTSEVARAEAGIAEATRETEALRSELRAQEAAQKNGVRMARAALDAARARLERVRAGSRKEEIARAQANVDALEQDLAKLKAGPRPQELAQARAAVSEAAAEVEARQRDADRKVALFDRGIVAGKDRDRAVADLEQARAKLQTAREAEALLREGPRREEVAAAEARVREARSELQLAQAGARPEEVAEAEAAVREAEARLADAEAAARQLGANRARIAASEKRQEAARAGLISATTQQGRSYVRAPFAGTVADVTASVGEQVSSQGSILELVNPAALRALLQFPARYAARLRPGTPIHLALPDGTTAEAALHHTVPVADLSDQMLTAEAWLRSAPPGWKEGLTVRGTARFSAGDEALLVPSSAVFDRGGEHFVYLLKEGKVEPTRVDVLGEDGQRTAVAGEVHAGDRVVRDGSLSLAEGTEVESR